MKKIAVLSLVCFAFSTPNTDCKSVHTGKFQIEALEGIYIITRTKDTQTEEVTNRGLISQFKIKWQSSCSYILYDRQVLKGTDIVPRGSEFDTLYCNISDVKEFTHKVTCKFKNTEPGSIILKKVR
ncbi:hypothetical protein AM493_19140 [Flavobacterium akiainvivens]|uniref:Uncharacterized protein n=1 Tax=Flavobacterium akiainvivens TaxID=1202724 RepID=A0A0M8MFP8_9FLAO|nr:hypothetical protein [Flavobacterium akiainvivens]KOS07934.1 hypothetical protein AM493_19140 [Flavobacterium akiainvivens]SFQ29202.1 hypothetical protein SAMN05444144_102410 [Flavobacterium akiainvivens]